MVNKRELHALLRPPPLRWFKLIVMLYVTFALAVAGIAFLVHPVFADPRPWGQKLAFYVPPILLGALLGSPALRSGVRWMHDLLRRPSGRGPLHPAHK